MRAMILLVLIPQVAAADCEDPKLIVEKPFATEMARTNFARCVSVGKEVMDILPRVDRMCYAIGKRAAGCAPGTDNCKPGEDHFESRRTFYLDVDDVISPTAVGDSLRSKQKDGCDKFMLENLSGGVDRRQALYNFRFRYADRACDKILGTHTICSGHVSGYVKYSLSSNLDLVPESHRGDPDGRCLGIIPARNSFTALNFVLFDAPTFQILNMVASKAYSGPRSIALPGVSSSSATIPGMELTNMEYVKEPDLGGFETSDGKYVLESAERGYLPGFMRSVYVDERHREIDFLRGLSKEPEKYVVKPGDTLGAIALRAYREPKLHLVLDYHNSINGRPIRAGEILTIPQPHEVCELINRNRSTVRKGESLWEKMTVGDLDASKQAPQVHSGDPNLIFPYEILEKKEVPNVQSDKAEALDTSAPPPPKDETDGSE